MTYGVYDLNCHGGSSARCLLCWGISNDPLNLEFSLPTKGYSFETLTIKRVWQENFPKFALEAQLRHILQDFLEICRDGSWTQWSDLDEPADEEANCVHYQRKKKRLMLNALEEKQHGLLVCLARYLQLRVPTVHEYCAICDKAFDLPPMMMRTVCSQELCTYQFAEFGSKITTAETVNHPSEILDLLVCMLSAAALLQDETISWNRTLWCSWRVRAPCFIHNRRTSSRSRRPRNYGNRSERGYK